MVSTIVHQLTKDLSMEEIEKSGFGPYYIDHTVGVWHRQPVEFLSMHVNSRVKVIRSQICLKTLLQNRKPGQRTIIFFELSVTFPEIADPIRFLRAREVVHFQRFGEALRSVQEQLDAKKKLLCIQSEL